MARGVLGEIYFEDMERSTPSGCDGGDLPGYGENISVDVFDVIRQKIVSVSEGYKSILQGLPIPFRRKSTKDEQSSQQLLSQEQIEMDHLGQSEFVDPDMPVWFRGHLFVPHHLSSPTWCDKCGDFIWGLYKQCVKCNRMEDSHYLNTGCCKQQKIRENANKRRGRYFGYDIFKLRYEELQDSDTLKHLWHGFVDGDDFEEFKEELKNITRLKQEVEEVTRPVSRIRNSVRGTIWNDRLMEFFQSDDDFQEFERVFETVKSKRFSNNLEKLRWSMSQEDSKEKYVSALGDDQNSDEFFSESRMDDTFSEFFDNDSDFMEFEKELATCKVKRRSKVLDKINRNSGCDIVAELKALCDKDCWRKDDNIVERRKGWSRESEWDTIFKKIKHTSIILSEEVNVAECDSDEENNSDVLNDTKISTDVNRSVEKHFSDDSTESDENDEISQAIMLKKMVTKKSGLVDRYALPPGFDDFKSNCDSKKYEIVKSHKYSRTMSDIPKIGGILKRTKRKSYPFGTTDNKTSKFVTDLNFLFDARDNCDVFKKASDLVSSSAKEKLHRNLHLFEDDCTTSVFNRKTNVLGNDGRIGTNLVLSQNRDDLSRYDTGYGSEVKDNDLYNSGHDCQFTCHHKCYPSILLNCKSVSQEYLDDIDSVGSSFTEPPDTLTSDLGSEATNEKDETDSGYRSGTIPEEKLPRKPSQATLNREDLHKRIEEYNSLVPGVDFALKEERGETFQGFIKVTLNLVRPISMSLGARPPSIYEMLTKEHIVDESTEAVSFYMPRDTKKSIHVCSDLTAKEVITSLLKKFHILDNPRKFIMYEQELNNGKIVKLRRIGDKECPLVVTLNWETEHIHKFRLVLQENETGEIVWEAFSKPELGNFLRVLDKEEEEYLQQLKYKYKVMKRIIQQRLKELRKERRKTASELEVSSHVSPKKS